MGPDGSVCMSFRCTGTRTWVQITSICVKSQAWPKENVILMLEEGLRDRRSTWPCRPPRWKISSSRFHERPCFKEIRQEERGGHTMSSSGLCACVNCERMRSHTYIPHNPQITKFINTQTFSPILPNCLREILQNFMYLQENTEH